MISFSFKLPAKREFFPQCEVIARYDAAGTRQEAARDEKVILFGIRPCDVQSLLYLDKVFADAVKEVNRRRSFYEKLTKVE